MKRVCLPIFVLFLTKFSHAQLKVANYALGKFDSDKFEQLSFWINDGKRTEIIYAYGKNEKEVRVTYLGKAVLKTDSCFKMKFPNNYILYAIPVGNTLKIIDSIGKYNKTFTWKYEGPVNGIGTFCDVCAEDEDAAMKIIKAYYMK